MSKKELNGLEVAEFIQARQASRVRVLKSAQHVTPRLAIVRTNKSQVIDTYLKLKQRYAEVIGAEVEVLQVSEAKAVSLIQDLNKREDIQGIIVQLPLEKTEFTDKLLNAIDSQKDVDGLATVSHYDPATPTAILWLLSAYNIEPLGKTVLVVGQGRLVGAPLTKMLTRSGVGVFTADETTEDLKSLVLTADIIISATGHPRLISEDMVKLDAVVVDAGTASENGVIVGDVDGDVRNRDDLKVTPIKGGVGPLTIAALFDNLLRACEAKL